MTDYNSIGQDYNVNRAADPRIIKQLIDLLDVPNNSKIVDIGSCTGYYTNK